MDLNDLVNLSRAVVHKVQQSISSGHEEIAWLLGLGELHYSFVKDLSSRSVVKDHRLSWQMPTFNLVKLDVLFTAAYDRILHHTIELNEESFKI